jgi:hypothetical protein
MKSVPDKKQIDETISGMVSATMESANHLAEATAREEPVNLADQPTKLVNFRLKVSDYNRLKGLYGSKGLSLSAGMRMTSLYMADMVEQGAFTLSAGGYIDQRGRR